MTYNKINLLNNEFIVKNNELSLGIIGTGGFGRECLLLASL